ncbi:MAG: glutamate racemase [Acidimicrobiaceae bacterium]|nr:glutamate racemase [Acidimicrobiaceae bacterium]
MDSRPIGFFDSGLGGLSILAAVRDLLPLESSVYFGDTDRYPYGSKPQEDVAAFALQIASYLVEVHDVKMIVVACNTASAAALDLLRTRLVVPVVGVIEAGVRAASIVSSSSRIGLIATVGTVGSGAYQRSFAEVASGVDLTCQACPGFVELVESGEADTESARVLARRLLEPILDAKVDTLLLGCTHYPFLARPIQDVMGRDVILVSSSEETAFEVRHMLEGNGLAAIDETRAPTEVFVSSGDCATFSRLAANLLGRNIGNVIHVKTSMLTSDFGQGWKS